MQILSFAYSKLFKYRTINYLSHIKWGKEGETVFWKTHLNWCVFVRTLRANRTPATVSTSCRVTRLTAQSAPGCSPNAVKGEENGLIYTMTLFVKSVGYSTPNLIAYFIIEHFYLLFNMCVERYLRLRLSRQLFTFEDIEYMKLKCLLSFGHFQAEEGVAETEVLSEGWIFDHLPWNGKRKIQQHACFQWNLNKKHQIFLSKASSS